MIPNRKEHSIPVIYLITCRVNGKIYVGSAKNFYRRHGSYGRDVKQQTKRRPIIRAMREYGFEQFEFSVLERVDNHFCLIIREQWWIDLLEPFGDRGYNAAPVAGSTLGRQMADETKAKLRKANLGKKPSVETLEKMKLASLGRKHSEEAKKRMSEIQKTRTARSGHKRSRPILKIGLAGQILGEYLTALEAAQAHGALGSSVTAACQGKHLLCCGYHWCYKDTYDPATFYRRPHQARGGPCGQPAKPVMQLDKDGQEICMWDTPKVAATSLGLHPDTVRYCCKGKLKSGGGYRWIWITDTKAIANVNRRRELEWRLKHG